MLRFTAHSFPAQYVRSLSWRGDELVDWVGGRSFSLGGEEQHAAVAYGDSFDAVAVSPDGRFAVIYAKMGTKGLLLDDGKLVRELNRSYYQAEAYEYPVTLFNDPTGRLLLAHCPDEYNRIELEDAVTGQALTTSDQRKPADFFHSRLAASPSGKRLLSAGWAWHPWSAVEFFDVAKALADPTHLDHGYLVQPRPDGEEGAACWLDDDTVVLGGPSDDDSRTEEGAPRNLFPRGLAVYDLARGVCLRAFQFDEPPGTLLPCGKGHVLSLYRHPKLIDLAAGKIVHVWSDLNSGLQEHSIIWHLADAALPPPIAFDAANGRFAISDRDAITVIQFALDGG